MIHCYNPTCTYAEKLIENRDQYGHLIYDALGGHMIDVGEYLPGERPYTAFCSEECHGAYYPNLPEFADDAPVRTIEDMQRHWLRKTSIPADKHQLYLNNPELLIEPNPTEPKE